ncbi:DNA-processing protein DprA [Burkholderia pseudomallei]|nr:DNA-processing protein DprA [Burkholderia pseudomallei]YP_010664153.1 rossmann fold nucleotide-binding protein [Burkholderia phage PhiBP82.2]AIP13739.1 DNA recombination-mediator A family protein [Burkholderia pseudomallei]AJX06685.1 DNA recombination-mediator A family protein [Burkholderia pseudomallei 1026b]RXS78438.1 DNA-processing protein DprA [Burkholderia pseudomallei]UKM53812.1 rossmann fold nucleotide-binding protein [Burkholderia phage PhiBP82.2]CAJ3045623.1 SMF family protein [Bu
MSNWLEFLESKPVNTHIEIGAYEHLWQQPASSTKRLAELFEANPGTLPSDLVDVEVAAQAASEVMEHFAKSGIRRFGVRINGTQDYPAGLRDAREPIEVLYFLGSWDLAESPRRIAVVGTRKVSEEGAARTRKLVRELVRHDFTVVSGLAQGVDTIAHQTAIEYGGRTIAVIGTPISEVYPRENAELQRKIAEEYLVVSQVPVLRYLSQTWKGNRFFFPERNKTMSALTQATVIIEAGETSGTLIQAQAALNQGRKLFILESNFNNPAITWPHKYEKLGAIRVREFDDIKRELM